MNRMERGSTLAYFAGLGQNLQKFIDKAFASRTFFLRVITKRDTLQLNYNGGFPGCTVSRGEISTVESSHMP